MNPTFIPNHRALSDVYGRIDQVLLSMRNVTDRKISKQLSGILKALGGRVHFILIGPQQSMNGDDKGPTVRAMKKEVARAKAFPEYQLYLVEPDFDDGPRTAAPSPWVADPFTVLVGASGTPILLEPYHFGLRKRQQDQYLAEQVSASTEYFMKSTRYLFEGGNNLVGDDYMLVGMDTLVENMNRFYPDLSPLDVTYKHKMDEIKIAFGNTFGVKFVIWVGEEEEHVLKVLNSHQGGQQRQVFFHIDLYLTLGGKTRDGEELVFLAEIQDEEFRRIPAALHAPWKKVANALDRLKDMLEHQHERCPSPKFKVERIPMGLKQGGNGNMVPLSLNNALVEVYQGVKVIYLPEYTTQSKDQAYLEDLASRTEKALEPHGFRPIWVKGDFYANAESYGSLHCITKVLRRSFRP